MSSVLAFVLLTSNFTAYPAFGDRSAVARPVPNAQRIEAATDKGPIVELIVKCASGTAIVSYSKLEKLYCGPRHGCDRALSPVASRACGS